MCWEEIRRGVNGKRKTLLTPPRERAGVGSGATRVVRQTRSGDDKKWPTRMMAYSFCHITRLSCNGVVEHARRPLFGRPNADFWPSNHCTIVDRSPIALCAAHLSIAATHPPMID